MDDECTFCGIVKTYHVKNCEGMNDECFCYCNEDTGTNICREYFINNGKKEGEYKIYWPKNGQLYKICNYVNGKKNGDSKSYWPDGKPQEICYYINGKPEGECIRFEWSGKLEVCCYKDDKKH